MDEATQLLISSSTKPISGGFDMSTTAGSNIVTSLAHDFISEGVSVGDTFIILDDTIDGRATKTSTITISSVGIHSLTLENAGSPFNLQLNLDDVHYSVNQEIIKTPVDPNIEKVRIFSKNGSEYELYSQNALYPDYSFKRDGYQDYVVINNGIRTGNDAILKTYGLVQQTCKQRIYMWDSSNIIRTIMPNPTSVSKIKITSILVPRKNIDTSSFAIIATIVGGHLINVYVSSLDFCQPTETNNGRRLTATINGNNFDFSGENEVGH